MPRTTGARSEVRASGFMNDQASLSTRLHPSRQAVEFQQPSGTRADQGLRSRISDRTGDLLRLRRRVGRESSATTSRGIGIGDPTGDPVGVRSAFRSERTSAGAGVRMHAARRGAAA